MRVVDVMLAMPGILLAIGIVAWLGRGLPQIMFAVAIVNVADLRPHPARQPAVPARIGLHHGGARAGRIGVADPAPAPPPEFAVAADRRGDARPGHGDHRRRRTWLLGLGPPDPRTPEWGTMLTDSTKFLRQAPWLLFSRRGDRDQCRRLQPAGDGLRELLDPRMTPMTAGGHAPLGRGPRRPVPHPRRHHPRRQRRLLPARGGRDGSGWWANPAVARASPTWR